MSLPQIQEHEYTTMPTELDNAIGVKLKSKSIAARSNGGSSRGTSKKKKFNVRDSVRTSSLSRTDLIRPVIQSSSQASVEHEQPLEQVVQPKPVIKIMEMHEHSHADLPDPDANPTRQSAEDGVPSN